MSTAERFLIAMTVIFLLPYAVWRLGRTDRWAPLVVVQIVSGILLGPGVLGAWAPELHQTLFAPAVMSALNGVAWWAVMLFVFLAGIELDLRDAWRHRRDCGITAGFAMGVPLLAGCGVALGMLAFSQGWMGALAGRGQFVLAIGMACAVTALPILILLMEKLEILRQPLGQRVLRYASLDDLAIWAVLALVLADWSRLLGQLVFLAVFALATRGVRAGMRRLGGNDRWALALVWLLLCALGADACGLHFMVGAFMAGAVLDAEWFGTENLDRARAQVLLLLMPVFFLSTGLRTQWQAGGWSVILAAAALLVACVGGKLAGLHLAGRLLGWAPGQARLIGWLLQTKALIMIVFANVLLDKQVISSLSFTALLLMAVASTMLTIPMVQPLLQPGSRRPADRLSPLPAA